MSQKRVIWPKNSNFFRLNRVDFKFAFFRLTFNFVRSFFEGDWLGGAAASLGGMPMAAAAVAAGIFWELF